MGSPRNTLLAIAFAVAAAIPGASFAAPACRDPNGKFIKCPVQTATPATRCKDSKGKFVKCSAPGAKPVSLTKAASIDPSPKPTKTAALVPSKPTKSPLNPLGAPATRTP